MDFILDVLLIWLILLTLGVTGVIWIAVYLVMQEVKEKRS